MHGMPCATPIGAPQHPAGGAVAVAQVRKSIIGFSHSFVPDYHAAVDAGFGSIYWMEGVVVRLQVRLPPLCTLHLKNGLLSGGVVISTSLRCQHNYSADLTRASFQAAALQQIRLGWHDGKNVHPVPKCRIAEWLAASLQGCLAAGWPAPQNACEYVWACVPASCLCLCVEPA